MAIEDLIVRRELAPRSAISEQELVSKLEIGRTPVREALQRLAGEGMVIIAPRRGVFVTDIKVDAQLRLLEVRRSLQRLLAGRAARLATHAQRQAFGVLAEDLIASGRAADDIEFLRLHQLFNRELTSVAGNEFAAAAFGLMGGLSRRFWSRYRVMADQARTASLHAEVARAIARGDPAGAEVASDALLDHLEALARSVFEAG